MDNFNEEVGNRIYKARMDKGITLKDLGDLVGIAESTAQRYEKGKIKSIDIEMIKKLAKALEISPALLMGWESDNNNSSYEDFKTFKELKDYLVKTIGEAELNRIASSSGFKDYTSLFNISLMKEIPQNDLPLTFFIRYLFASFPKLTILNMVVDIDNVKDLYKDVKNYTEFSLKKIINKKEIPDYIQPVAAHLDGELTDEIKDFIDKF